MINNGFVNSAHRSDSLLSSSLIPDQFSVQEKTFLYRFFSVSATVLSCLSLNSVDDMREYFYRIIFFLDFLSQRKYLLLPLVTYVLLCWEA